MSYLTQYLFNVKWLLTRWPAARAESKDNSPASTVLHTICANFVAFLPGSDLFAPWIPSICNTKQWNKNSVKVWVNIKTNSVSQAFRVACCKRSDSGVRLTSLGAVPMIWTPGTGHFQGGGGGSCSKTKKTPVLWKPRLKLPCLKTLWIQAQQIWYIPLPK